jgi:hypothetical protein
LERQPECRDDRNRFVESVGSAWEKRPQCGVVVEVRPHRTIPGAGAVPSAGWPSKNAFSETCMIGLQLRPTGGWPSYVATLGGHLRRWPSSFGGVRSFGSCRSHGRPMVASMWFGPGGDERCRSLSLARPGRGTRSRLCRDWGGRGCPVRISMPGRIRHAAAVEHHEHLRSTLADTRSNLSLCQELRQQVQSLPLNHRGEPQG